MTTRPPSTEPTDLQRAPARSGMRWTYQRRQDYANDLTHPEHLLAVKAALNRSKGAKGPDQWRPPDTSYHCQYANDWESIKQRWGLEISESEADAVAEMRAHCP